MDGRGLLRLENFNQVTNGNAGFNQVFDNDDITSLKWLGHLHDLFSLARGCHAVVRLHANERHFTIALKTSNEVRGKEKSPIERNEKDRTLATVVAIDLFGKLVNDAVKLIFGKKRHEVFPVYLYHCWRLCE